jgi:hypothetical protein
MGRGDWQGMDQFAFANSPSVVRGLNHFAWTLLGVALFLIRNPVQGSGEIISGPLLSGLHYDYPCWPNNAIRASIRRLAPVTSLDGTTTKGA